MQEEMSVTETAEDASLPSEMDKKENILQSDALKSDRLTFAFQCGWQWGEEIGRQAAKTGWKPGRGDGRGPPSPDIFPGSQHSVCVCARA